MKKAGKNASYDYMTSYRNEDIKCHEYSFLL